MAISLDVERVLSQARFGGYVRADDRTARVSATVSKSLLDAARASSGLTTDEALLEYALAKVAMTDDFGERVAQLHGTVPKDVELDF